MILEMLPNVQRLPASEKRQLAEELLREADETDEVDVDPVILELLESRLAYFTANPANVASWDQVRARVFHTDGS